jgi:AcrR family transcriptional regulator
MGERKTYHHGDLRNALLSAGLVILEEQGLHKLSLRDIAERAGVSHAAPAHHFGSLKGLLTALVTLAHGRFAAAMALERAGSEASPAEQMRAAGRGYLAFARQHPALFRLMFSSAEIDWTNPDLHRAAGLSRRHLTEIARPAAEAVGAVSAAEITEIENLVWASVHGYAVLAIDGHLGGAECAAPAPMPDIARFLFASAPAIASPYGAAL